MAVWLKISTSRQGSLGPTCTRHNTAALFVPEVEYAEPRVLLHIGLLVKSQLKGKEKVMADPETQEESQWIVPQRILSALTIPGFN